jgi:hypothetical protein
VFGLDVGVEVLFGPGGGGVAGVLVWLLIYWLVGGGFCGCASVCVYVYACVLLVGLLVFVGCAWLYAHHDT